MRQNSTRKGGAGPVRVGRLRAGVWGGVNGFLAVSWLSKLLSLLGIACFVPTVEAGSRVRSCPVVLPCVLELVASRKSHFQGCQCQSCRSAATKPHV